jgi:transposase
LYLSLSIGNSKARDELTRVSCTPSFLGRKAACPSRYDPNTKSKAIRLVREHAGDYPTEYAAITAVAGRLGMTPETLRKWIRQAEVDEGKAPGTSTGESAQIRELKRKNRELEQAIEILKAAMSFFRAGVRPATDLICHFIDDPKEEFGSCRSAVRYRCTEYRSPRAPTGHTVRMPCRKGKCGIRR